MKSYVSGEEDANLIPQGASHDCIAQSWFRFLHCLGNPVNLSRPTVISQTPKFLQFAIASENVVDPCQHPCLTALPQIFFKAIKGIAGQVDAFLGNVGREKPQMYRCTSASYLRFFNPNPILHLLNSSSSPFVNKKKRFDQGSTFPDPFAWSTLYRK